MIAGLTHGSQPRTQNQTGRSIGRVAGHGDVALCVGTNELRASPMEASVTFYGRTFSAFFWQEDDRMGLTADKRSSAAKA